MIVMHFGSLRSWQNVFAHVKVLASAEGVGNLHLLDNLAFLNVTHF